MSICYQTKEVSQKKSIWQDFWFQRITENPRLNYQKKEAFSQRLEQLKNHSWNSNLIYDWFVFEHQSLDLSVKQKQNLEKIKNSNTRFILTGQQPQILTGSIYTFYKSLTAIKQAQIWSDTYGESIIPVFWIAGEDTDALECGHLEIVENQNNYNLLDPLSHKKMMSFIEIKNLMEELVSKLKSQWSVEMIDFFQSINQKSKTLSEWFKELLHFFLKDTGLLFVDGSSAQFQKLAQPKMNQIVTQSQKFSELLQKGSRDLIQKYGKTQVKIKDQIHAFEIQNNERFQVESSNYNIEKIYTHNVLSRAVLISAVLPVMAHVLGSSEMGYFLQLREILSEWEQGEPLMIPRMSAFIYPKRLKIKIEEFGINFEEFMFKSPSKVKLVWIDKYWKQWIITKGYSLNWAENLEAQLQNQIENKTIPSGLYRKVTEKLIRTQKQQNKQWIKELQKQFLIEKEKEYKEFLKDFEWFCSGRSQDRCLNIFSLVNQLGFGSFPDFFLELDPLSTAQQLIFWEQQC